MDIIGPATDVMSRYHLHTVFPDVEILDANTLYFRCFWTSEESTEAGIVEEFKLDQVDLQVDRGRLPRAVADLFTEIPEINEVRFLIPFSGEFRLIQYSRTSEPPHQFSLDSFAIR